MSRNPYCAAPLRECRRKVAALNADKKVLSDSEATLLRRVRELTAQRDACVDILSRLMADPLTVSDIVLIRQARAFLSSAKGAA